MKIEYFRVETAIQLHAVVGLVLGWNDLVLGKRHRSVLHRCQDTAAVSATL